MYRHRMVGSFQHIKVCIQNSGKQCGRHLAFASSKYLDDFAILIACCLLVSFFCRCITYDTIKREGFSRQNDLSVADRCRKSDVVNSSARSTCCAGAVTSKRVFKQICVHLLGCNLRLGKGKRNRDIRIFFCTLILGFRTVRIHWGSVFRCHNGISVVRIQRRIDRLGINLACNSGKIRLRQLIFCRRAGNYILEIHCCHIRLDLLF